MLTKNKRYIVRDVIDQLNTGDIVRTNGDTDSSLYPEFENGEERFIEGMIFKPNFYDVFYVLNNTHNGSGNSYARNGYQYGWCINDYNDEAWIELVGPVIEPKKLLLDKIKVLTKVTK